MTAMADRARLSRTAVLVRDGVPLPSPPVRIVHMGLGAFHRAHQAWYTAVADTDNEWGITAFTNSSLRAAQDLQDQEGLYTLTLRGPVEDEYVIVPSIVSALCGQDTDAFLAALAAPSTAIVTLTITEAGYRLTSDGVPDLADAVVAADVQALREAAATGGTPLVQSALARLVIGLEARRRGAADAIAIVPCDNMPRNGELVRRGVAALAAELNLELVDWLATHVSFVSTSVDRITPRTTEDDIERVARDTGWDDRAAVVAEPFSNWVLCGDFPAGRPEWHKVGAQFVSDIEPFERRKLWLLNGAHTLLATLGQLRGHDTVAEAIADPECADAVRALWAEAVRHLPAEELDLDSYRADLIERFRNARIEHRLAQIAEGSELKLRVRIAPVARRERDAGRDADACALAIAAWIVLRETESDAGGDPRVENATLRSALRSIDPELADDQNFTARVTRHCVRLSTARTEPEHDPASTGGHRP
jgi:fructuronate reductase